MTKIAASYERTTKFIWVVNNANVMHMSFLGMNTVKVSG